LAQQFNIHSQASGIKNLQTLKKYVEDLLGFSTQR
jgi:hypothetical protein